MYTFRRSHQISLNIENVRQHENHKKRNFGSNWHSSISVHMYSSKFYIRLYLTWLIIERSPLFSCTRVWHRLGVRRIISYYHRIQYPNRNLSLTMLFTNIHNASDININVYFVEYALLQLNLMMWKRKVLEMEIFYILIEILFIHFHRIYIYI